MERPEYSGMSGFTEVGKVYTCLGLDWCQRAVWQCGWHISGRTSGCDQASSRAEDTENRCREAVSIRVSFCSFYSKIPWYKIAQGTALACCLHPG